jgi:hypothetical protein
MRERVTSAESRGVASLITLVRALPWAFAGRLSMAFVEIALAGVILSTSIVMGHELRDWRTFYADASKPWAPTHAPTASPMAEPRP